MAILGVPLALGGDVLGVLYAANRTARPFAREEVSLLVSLAAHAAVAIDSARLLEETSARWPSSSAPTSSWRRTAGRWSGPPTPTTGWPSSCCAAAAWTTWPPPWPRCWARRCWCWTTRASSGLLARRAESRWSTTAAGCSQRGGGARAALDAGRTAQSGPVWLAPVVAGSTRLGDVVLVGHDALVDADQRILERAALVTALLLLFRRASPRRSGGWPASCSTT